MHSLNVMKRMYMLHEDVVGGKRTLKLVSPEMWGRRQLGSNTGQYQYYQLLFGHGKGGADWL